MITHEERMILTHHQAVAVSWGSAVMLTAPLFLKLLQLAYEAEAMRSGPVRQFHGEPLNITFVTEGKP